MKKTNLKINNNDKLQNKFLYNQSIVKIVGVGDNKWIKIVNMNVIRKKNVDKVKIEEKVKEEKLSEITKDVKKSKKGSKNNEKLGCNIRATKSRIRELIMCNEWEYMVTFTLNGDRYNRTDLDTWKKEFLQWVQNYRKKYGIDIKYIFVPELHKDNITWHMHGLIKGLPLSHLRQIVNGDSEYKRLEKRVRMGYEVYVWEAYQQKFGYCDVEKIRNKEAVCNYLTKSIKDNTLKSKGVSKVNAKMYYVSRGLKRAEIVKRGTQISTINQAPTYANKYCKVYWQKFNKMALETWIEGIDDEAAGTANNK